MSLSETPEEFWYKNLAKYSTPAECDQGFPTNVYITSLYKIKCSEIVFFKGHFKNGDSLTITYPRNTMFDGTLMIKNFIGIGIGESELEAELHVTVFPLNYEEPMDDSFLFDLLENSYGWEIKDYGDLSIY